MVFSLFLIHFHTLIIIIIFLIVPSSNGNNAQYIACSSLYSCGPVTNIGYPFWGDDRPEFCGLREFKLSCHPDENYPVIKISKEESGRLSVLHINTSTHTIVVSPRYFRDTDTPPCATQLKNGKLNLLTSLKLDGSVTNISLFSNCPVDWVSRYHPKSFSCSNFDGANASIFYFDNPSEISKMNKSCANQTTVRVDKRNLDELNKGNANLLSILGKGFKMEYTVNFTACSMCEKSGGRCGSPDNSSSEEFVCYCPHGKPHSLTCPKSGSKKLRLILGGGIGGTLLLVALLTAICYCKRLKFHHSKLVTQRVSLNRTQSELEKGSIYFGVPLFSYRELLEATDNFDQSKELGNGGYGTVYYGKLKDGRKVAVKRLYEKSYKRIEQFMNEVQILTCLRHQNLVSLFGCTSHHCKELLLVYEYVSNGTVADHLYGEKDKLESLSWPVRLRIAIETAGALSYLHASDIIHRDVKTNNILLDSTFSVKVADFGLSRLFPNDVTHVSTAPQGTPGYVDPEYHQCYQLTNKSDVYSFGVVLVELISSLPAVDMNRHRHEINLSHYAMNRIQRCAFDELVDPQLGFASDFKVRKMTTSVAELAFQCLQHDKEFRPPMDEVLEVLKRIESADYEAMEAGEVGKNDGVMRSSNPPPSPTEDDHTKLLSNHKPHPLSPVSVTDKWRSRSTTPSTTLSTSK